MNAWKIAYCICGFPWIFIPKIWTSKISWQICTGFPFPPFKSIHIFGSGIRGGTPRFASTGYQFGSSSECCGDSEAADLRRSKGGGVERLSEANLVELGRGGLFYLFWGENGTCNMMIFKQMGVMVFWKTHSLYQFVFLSVVAFLLLGILSKTGRCRM